MSTVATNNSLSSAMLSASLYKRNQGRMVRQLTFLGMVLAALYGTWTLSNQILSSYVNSALTIAVSYPASTASQIEGKFTEFFGAEPYDKSNEGGVHRARFSSVTSKYWETDPELRSSAAERFSSGKDSALEYEGVKVSEPTHRVRQVTWIRIGIPVALSAIAVWCAFRAVNYSRFADFLISVEAEMDKVSWASRGELYRATIVVLTTMTFLGALLFVYDQLWVVFFRLVRFLEI